ncbi:DoxX family membrane protein [Aquimarina sp. 2201CG5-10]|uniref:DoxX family membrane protein n=1 Tax=Aquimarina callyspongiae TaxID=3098150 RepID=UPI002AB4A8ED|nr:DoxX family membrane protein [Aquimarina sp. 2201CG5-10]MDY8137499.1 DoxX family membrane protein [Aquimarina sp. 2201CG5-10]
MKKDKIIDFGVLALRWYLAFYMISYGWSKLTLSQFGVYDPSILEQPIKDIDSFYVAWHLYGRSTFFNISTGVLEIIGGILLIFNRTVLIGALLVLSILAQILIIDIAFTTGIHGFALPVRIGGMIIADLLILYYYRHKIVIVWKTLTNGISTKFKYKWWVFLILPIVGFLMDFVLGILTLPVKILLNWITK